MPKFLPSLGTMPQLPAQRHTTDLSTIGAYSLGELLPCAWSRSETPESRRAEIGEPESGGWDVGADEWWGWVAGVGVEVCAEL